MNACNVQLKGKCPKRIDAQIECIMCGFKVHVACVDELLEKLNLLNNEALSNKALCCIECVRYSTSGTVVSPQLVKQQTSELFENQRMR